MFESLTNESVAELRVRTGNPNLTTAAELSVRAPGGGTPCPRHATKRASSGSPEPLERLGLSPFRSPSWEECEDIHSLTSIPSAVSVHLTLVKLEPRQCTCDSDSRLSPSHNASTKGPGRARMPRDALGWVHIVYAW